MIYAEKFEGVSKAVCSYYGRLLVESYEANGGKVDRDNIDQHLADVARDAGVAAAKPLIERKAFCNCGEFTNDPKFAGVSTTFTCPKHRTVTVYRVSPPYTQFPYYYHPYVSPNFTTEVYTSGTAK